MLVLSRNLGEEIVIGERIVVGVARVDRDRVYLTIKAPKSIRVDRKEIWLAKKQQANKE
ncbi:MAG: carbon storage regulator [Thermoguttaceae bacterium]